MKKILLLFFSFGLALSVWAQDRVVTGKVSSKEDGSALPGVNVLIKGTTNGTVTDADGKFSLSVPSNGGTLVFSFIGLKSEEVEIGERTVVDVQLSQDITQLSEVVVTALGIEKSKNELGYAAQKIDGSLVSQTRDNNFVNSLSGKIAGVDIKRPNGMGGSTNVIIRGVKSLSSNNQALFVVDGVPIDNSNTNNAGNNTGQSTGGGGYDYGNAAADINADDIESINVLKGAAASALYGSRAANGVIMITTKKGKKKNGVGLTVNYGITTGSIDKSTFPTYQKRYGGGYGAYYEDPSGFFLYRDHNNWSDLSGAGPDLVVPMSEDASWGAAFDATKNVYQWDAFDPSSPNYNKATPWVAAKHQSDYMFNKPVSTNFSLLLDGQTDKGYYKMGYTRNYENGMMPNSSLAKDFFNFSASYKMSSKLTATGALNVSNIDGKGRYGTGYDGASARNLMTTFREWYETNVDNKDLRDAYFRTGKNVTWNWTDPSNLTPIYWDNPYWTRYKNYQNDNRLRAFGYAMLNYNATKWMDIMGQATIDTYNEQQEERVALGSVGVSGYSRFNRHYIETNYTTIANFHHDFGSDFKVTGLLGWNQRVTKTESIFSSTNGGLVVPDLYAISNSANLPLAPTETISQLAVNGAFAGASVTWKKMVTIDANFRRDQGSSLPKSNNAYNYGSISGSWLFSELFQNNWLSGGKLRANYAQVGDVAAPNSITDVYGKPAAFGNTTLFNVNTTKFNNLLKPAITHSYEFGAEASFFDARVGFDVTYYHTSTINQILTVPVSRATGYNSKVVNAGELTNQGWEVHLYGDIIRTSNFKWTTNINWTRNRNHVVSLAQGLDNYQLGAFQGGVSINAAIGQPFGTIRGNDFVYTNGQRTIRSVSSPYYAFSASSNNAIGNIQPDWMAGINNKFTYKGFSASFLIDIKQGGQLFNLDMYYGLATGLYPETAGNNEYGHPLRSGPNDFGDGHGGVLVKGVMPDGSPNVTRYNATNFGIFGYRRNPAAAFIYNAGYIKLREVVLSYAIPSSVIKKLRHLNGIDVSLVGRNLWIIQKHVPYADPEDNLGSGLLSSGYQVGTYPNVRNYGFNLKFKF